MQFPIRKLKKVFERQFSCNAPGIPPFLNSSATQAKMKDLQNPYALLSLPNAYVITKDIKSISCLNDFVACY